MKRLCCPGHAGMRGSERADRPASSENKMEVILSINDGQLFYEHSESAADWLNLSFSEGERGVNI